MTNKKSTKRALVSSALAVLMCVTMLIGTTFAWFTDSASTAVNKIQAGNLDVALEMYENGEWVSAEGKTLNFVAKDGNENILWEPGCTYKLPDLRIVNNGNLALKYQVVISGINGDAKLNEAIEWKLTTPVGDWGEIPVTMAPGYNSWEGAPITSEGGEGCVLKISGHMKKDAGNEYQGLSIDGIAITVMATQYTYENDTNGDTYDADATYASVSVWDGKTETAPVKTDDVYHITNAAEFAQYINELNDAPATKGHRYDYAKVVLDSDIDLGGAVLTVSGEGYMFSGSFDGNGHTVSNFTVERTDGELYTGLFSVYMSSESNTAIKNLIVKNGTVISNGKQAAAIVPSVNENATVENCHAIGCTVSGVKKVGAVTGYVGASTATVKNCSARDCSVVASNNDSVDANLFGYNNGGNFVGNADNGNNSLRYGE